MALRPRRAAAAWSSASTTWCSTPGEAAEFDTRTPHWFGPVDGRGVEFLSLFGKQGERAHLRARPAGG